MFEIFLDIPAQAFLEKEGESVHSRVRETFEELAFDPIPPRAKRVIDSKEKLFRLRSRHFRFLYRIDYEKKILVVIIIEPIRRMYH
jgi:mRNA-degrading endonuclease RelE of RelBE toxin-antitoxin system